MDWLIGIATVVGGWVALQIVGEIVGETLHPLIKRVYSPPHGGYILACTWLAALALAALALIMSEWSDGWRSAFTIIPIALALFASFIYRDERRRVLGLPEIVTVVPDRFGWPARLGLGLLSGFALTMTVVVSFLDGWEKWGESLGFLLFAMASGVVAVTGRMPDIIVTLIGAQRRSQE